MRLMIFSLVFCCTVAQAQQTTFPPSQEGNTVTLRDYVERRFAEQKEATAAALAAAALATSAALAAADRAISKAEIATEKRFESVNEFRQALSDSARLTIPRAEVEQIIKSLQEKLERLEERATARDERERGAGNLWLIIAAACGTMFGLAATAIALFRQNRILT